MWRGLDTASKFTLQPLNLEQLASMARAWPHFGPNLIHEE